MDTYSQERLKLSQDGITALKWLMHGDTPGFRKYDEMVESEQQESLERGFGELIDKKLAHAYGGLYGCGENLELYGDPLHHKQWLEEALDSNVNPDHYRNSRSGIEAYKVLEFLSFHEGCAAKYLMRLGKKDVTLQELKKSEWYITHCIDLIADYDAHLKQWGENVQKFMEFADSSPEATDVDRMVALILEASCVGGSWMGRPENPERQLMLLNDALKLVQMRIKELADS